MKKNKNTKQVRSLKNPKQSKISPIKSMSQKFKSLSHGYKILTALSFALIFSGVSAYYINSSDAAAGNALVATYNAPGRYSDVGRKNDIQKLANRGVSIIALQENRDNDPAKIKPNNWGHHRPDKARSAAVIWDKSVWDVKDRGAWQLHSDSMPLGAPRYAVWVHLKHKKTGKLVRYASAHLPAFKTKTQVREKEFRYQEKRLAQWLSGGRHRVVGCDCNASPGGSWMDNIKSAARYHTPLLGTGPSNQKIDHIWRNKAKSRAHSAYTLKGVSDHKMLVAKLPLE